jgi:hypothetical protein
MKAVPLLLTLWLVSASPAGAADLSDPVAGHPGLTQFDLAKLVVTDLARGTDGTASGAKVVRFRHIEGKSSLVDLPDPLAVAGIEVMPMPGDPSREILLIDFGPSEGFVADGELMALFRLDAKPRLLDVVQVGADKNVGWTTPPAMLAPDAPLLVIESEHDNSNQTYVQNALVTVQGDRFRWIDTVFTFSDHACGYQRIQQPAFKARKTRDAVASIDVRVVEETKAIPDDNCGDDKVPKPSRRVFDTVYRWNAAKKSFTPNNKAIERLSEEDQKRF